MMTSLLDSIRFLCSCLLLSSINSSNTSSCTSSNVEMCLSSLIYSHSLQDTKNAVFTRLGLLFLCANGISLFDFNCFCTFKKITPKIPIFIVLHACVSNERRRTRSNDYVQHHEKNWASDSFDEVEIHHLDLVIYYWHSLPRQRHKKQKTFNNRE
jgi:hypothetical protein